MKLGRQKSTKRKKKTEDAVTPPTSNDSPKSLDQRVNVDNIVREGSPHQMIGDVFVLAFTSTYVTDMTCSSKKKKT